MIESRKTLFGIGQVRDSLEVIKGVVEALKKIMKVRLVREDRQG